MKTLYVARHGETTWNAKGRIQGRSNAPLSHRGLVQTSRTAAALGALPFDLVLSSPLDRSRSLAEAVARRVGCSMQILPELTEVDFGCWQGRSWDDIFAADPLNATRWDKRLPDARADGGESIEEVYARAIALRDIIDAQPFRLCLITGHGAFNRFFFTALLRLPVSAVDSFSQSNACLSVFEFDGNAWHTQMIDSTEHLRNRKQ